MLGGFALRIYTLPMLRGFALKIYTYHTRGLCHKNMHLLMLRGFDKAL
jgi:hypothetical protein